MRASQIFKILLELGVCLWGVCVRVWVGVCVSMCVYVWVYVFVSECMCVGVCLVGDCMCVGVGVSFCLSVCVRACVI
jgi:hypothetical protein